MSAGLASTCGIRPNGFVLCWGKNNIGQTSPPTNSRFKQISVGIKNHVCGITLEGSVKCWGNNSRGQADEKPGIYLNQIDHMLHCLILINANNLFLYFRFLSSSLIRSIQYMCSFFKLHRQLLGSKVSYTKNESN